MHAVTDSIQEYSTTLQLNKQAHRLSPMQKKFNDLLVKIEKAHQRNTKRKKKLDDLLAIAGESVVPVIGELNRLVYMWIKLVREKIREEKFLGDDLFILDALIGERINYLSRSLLGLSEIEALELQNLSKEMLTESFKAMSKKEFKQFKNEFGGEMFGDLMDGVNSPEDLTDLIVNFTDEAQSENFDGKGFGQEKKKENTKERKKTPKQVQKEADILALQNLKDRELKSIYKDLAKVIHPDTEQDSNLRDEKEEIMKQLTQAYANRDLKTLLELEARWLSKGENDTDELFNEKLRLHILLLQEQLTNIEAAGTEIVFNTHYQLLEQIGIDLYYPNRWNPKAVITDVQMEAKSIRIEIDLLSGSTAQRKRYFKDTIENNRMRMQMNMIRFD